jgi:energy-coupling factor transporter transmembrane protein EcfT
MSFIVMTLVMLALIIPIAGIERLAAHALGVPYLLRGVMPRKDFLRQVLVSLSVPLAAFGLSFVLLAIAFTLGGQIVLGGGAAYESFYLERQPIGAALRDALFTAWQIFCGFFAVIYEAYRVFLTFDPQQIDGAAGSLPGVTLAGVGPASVLCTFGMLAAQLAATKRPRSGPCPGLSRQLSRLRGTCLCS